MANLIIDKIMKFRILTLEVTKTANIPNGLPFRWLTHHVKEIFMALLPDIEINNSSKVEISFGPRGEEAIFDGILGVTNCFVENFDFYNFYLLSPKEQDLVILDEIQKALISICLRNSNNQVAVDSIKNTICKIIDIGVELDININKLTKTTYDKRYRFKIYRILDRTVGEAWRCHATDYNSQKEVDIWMTNVPSYINRNSYFKKAEIINNTYTIYNHLSKITFEINIEELFA